MKVFRAFSAEIKNDDGKIWNSNWYPFSIAKDPPAHIIADFNEFIHPFKLEPPRKVLVAPFTSQKTEKNRISSPLISERSRTLLVWGAFNLSFLCCVTSISHISNFLLFRTFFISLSLSSDSPQTRLDDSIHVWSQIKYLSYLPVSL